MEKFIIPSLAAAALLVAAEPWALAGTNHMGMNSNTSSTPNSQSEIGTPPKTDIAPFQSAKLSLTEAIHAAQQQHKGKTVEARFEQWQGQSAYLVRTCANNQMWESRINANSGQLIGTPRRFTADQLTGELKQEAKAVRGIHTSLTQAVKNAEASQGGKAIMAKVQIGSNNKAGYDVDVVKNGQLHTAMVNGSTGNVG